MRQGAQVEKAGVTTGVEATKAVAEAKRAAEGSAGAEWAEAVLGAVGWELAVSVEVVWAEGEWVEAALVVAETEAVARVEAAAVRARVVAAKASAVAGSVGAGMGWEAAARGTEAAEMGRVEVG